MGNCSNCKNAEQHIAGKDTGGQKQMLMLGSIDQETGAVNRENDAITHPLSQIPGYATNLKCVMRYCLLSSQQLQLPSESSILFQKN